MYHWDFYALLGF
ncbi:hypothetical protein JCP62_00275 [Enterococcus faecium]|nr:hypothetical protein JCP62_00275 [Enterococcus faecium]HDF2428029.1 hypothetical protein [Clostridioides difficile]HDF2428816.1 hypothetical protein [Clostridioides difficile]HDF5590125.1 hypothetical protein [Clostridioides difficile]HDF5591339.1 hypothetical protein [Clostridioides difficile]